MKFPEPLTMNAIAAEVTRARAKFPGNRHLQAKPKDEIEKEAIQVVMTHTAHTPGRLKASLDKSHPRKYLRPMALVITANESGIAIDCTGSGKNYQEDCANARRIVATWNACEGIPTEDLEQKVVVGFMADLKRQRDEQITLLREWQSHSKVLRETNDLQDIMARTAALLGKARP